MQSASEEVGIVNGRKHDGSLLGVRERRGHVTLVTLSDIGCQNGVVACASVVKRGRIHNLARHFFARGRRDIRSYVASKRHRGCMSQENVNSNAADVARQAKSRARNMEEHFARLCSREITT